MAKGETFVRVLKAEGNLNSEEGFVLSRLGAGIKMGELLPLCPWPEEQTLRILEELRKKNCIEWNEEKSPYEAYLLKDASELQNLETNFRIDVWSKLESLSNQNPYQILETHPYASTAEIKEAYLALSKRFHPDRFFTKKLGHYKEKLDFIFTHIQKAYAVLKNSIEREALDRQLALQKKSTAPAANSLSAEDKLKRARKLAPEMEKMAKAETYFQEGMKQQKAGNFVAAYNSFGLAAQTYPERDNYSSWMEAVKPMMAKQKAKETMESAMKSAELGMTADILKMAQDALRLDPTLPSAQYLVGRGIVELNLVDQIRDAKEMLARAKVGLPKDAGPCYFLAKALLGMGDSKLARRECEEALKRNPKYTAAQKLLEKL